MMKLTALTRLLWLPVTVAILYLAAVGFRPLLPVDETRYVSVAWEMYLRSGWFDPLTLNFEPYHHKPPLLFWLMNLSWAIFGVSRWAATIPIVLSALACVYLTGILGRLLFPQALEDTNRTRLVMVAGVPFLTYGTILMFDITLTAFVLLSLIGVVLYSRQRSWRHIVLIGVSLGLGGLAKGPFAPFCIFFPILLAPYWAKNIGNVLTWYAGNALAGLISLAIVLVWLIPVLTQSDSEFAYWLLWKQTAGRVTGSVEDHLAPFYAYLPLLPAMFVPWVFVPGFWKGLAKLRSHFPDSEGKRFLICWLVPSFLGFCLFSNKQPHYLMPLMPGAVLLAALCLPRVSTDMLARTMVLMVTLFVAGQAIASATFLHRYDLAPVAAFVSANRDKDWAFAQNYHGEFGFLSRLEKPVDDVRLKDLDAWFSKHPDGFAAVIYRNPAEVAGYRQIMDGPYRGRRMGVYGRSEAQ
ncbi:ArnT family glycosyltransferase [Mycoplana dimorpha]|uniref:4-amino-4-deoxy-L-arabinose transferase-like glycosyltransferase n=1 Tax=Mycoplana dimorpha TaxID=28320 RepID=A0A2T5BIL6_MYCDI|nr:glycosyltransferase family 39 protein [Mycoplana dimorpha]PTM98816.1 4-amino-4-deoxy-L-arabinose transferase-like glycosyltransferase [Mycoplana dimorpha]